MLPSPGFGLACDSTWCETLTANSFQAQLPKKHTCILYFFKGGERHKSELWPWLGFSSLGCFIHIACPGTRWWRFTCVCLCAKNGSPWQAYIYLMGLWRTGTERKHFSLPKCWCKYIQLLFSYFQKAIYHQSVISHLEGKETKGWICFTRWVGHEDRTGRLSWAFCVLPSWSEGVLPSASTGRIPTTSMD